MAGWFTENGQLVTSDTALIEYRPVLLGQTSSFKAINTLNPEMTNGTLSFKGFFGGTLPTREKE